MPSALQLSFDTTPSAGTRSEGHGPCLSAAKVCNREECSPRRVEEGKALTQLVLAASCRQSIATRASVTRASLSDLNLLPVPPATCYADQLCSTYILYSSLLHSSQHESWIKLATVRVHAAFATVSPQVRCRVVSPAACARIAAQAHPSCRAK